jgi:uncharacterized protein YjbJ (UPF0337 family)
MDRDRTEGAAKKMTGGVKETAGKALGDSKLETEGKAEKTQGRIQNVIGGVKDKLRELAGSKPKKRR